MWKLILSAVFICTVFTFPIRSEANCSKDLDRLAVNANWPSKPLDSDFHAAASNVRLRAHLILKEELDNSVDQTWWQPKGRYFKAIYQSKKSKNLVIAIFDREDGMWAYQLKSKSVVKENVCINLRRLSIAVSELIGKTQ